MTNEEKDCLIPPEQIPSVHFFLDIIKVVIVTVGDDDFAFLLELFQIVHHPAIKEG